MNTNIAPEKFLTTIAAALIALFALASCGDMEAPEPTRFIPDWRTYENREIGLRFEYPYNLNLDAATSADGQLEAELLWVGSEAPVLRVETRESGPDDNTAAGGAEIDGQPATETALQIDGEPMRRLAVTSGGRLFTFTGSGTTFEKIIESVKFSDLELRVPESTTEPAPHER